MRSPKLPVAGSISRNRLLVVKLASEINAVSVSKDASVDLSSGDFHPPNGNITQTIADDGTVECIAETAVAGS